MLGIALILTLAQVATAERANQVDVATPLTWSDGHHVRKLFLSPTLVAERAPSDAGARQVRAVDATATIVVSRPSMRVWRVQNATQVLAALPALRPALQDVRNAGRFRVPVGLVCGAQVLDVPWRDVLSRSGAECLPNFWYAPVLR